MQLWDILLTGGVVALAVWYLYRKFVIQGGCSCGNGRCAGKRPGSIENGSKENGGCTACQGSMK